MGTRLYVANLPHAPSALALRAHFSTCGVVANVEIIRDRNGDRGRETALIQMSSAVGADRAVSELNGAPFAGQLLLVEAAPDRAGDARGAAASRRAARNEEEQSPARITQQFREPANMTYELDCAGVALVIRFFFPSGTDEWRIAVQTSREADAPSTSAAAPSRVEAFRSVVRTCREGVDFPDLRHIDWGAVEEAMSKVRAL